MLHGDPEIDLVRKRLGEMVPDKCAFDCLPNADRCEDLFPAERAAIANSVEKRRREFSTGRACARSALQQLHVTPVDLPVGPTGHPVWPPAIIASITHTDRIAAAIAMRGSPGQGIGLDIEVWSDVSYAVLQSLLHTNEGTRSHTGAKAETLPGIIFSAKESAFKAWSGAGLAPRSLRDIEIRLFDGEERFTAVTPAGRGQGARSVKGSYAIAGDYLVSLALCNLG